MTLPIVALFKLVPNTTVGRHDMMQQAFSSIFASTGESVHEPLATDTYASLQSKSRSEKYSLLLYMAI